MHTNEMIIRPVVGADEGYYITPNGMVLKVIAVTTGWGYKWTKVRQSGKQKSMFIHRMVASAFVPNPDNKPQVNHKNGDKFDNRSENLEWVTPSENKRHAHALGLIKPHQQPVSMFDTEGQLLRTFRSQKDAAEFVHAKRTCNISMCINGKQKTAHGYAWKRDI